jgi:hypothetical protein
MHELSELNHTGDTKTLWNPDNATEVEIAEHAFNTFRRKGFSIFRVDTDGAKGTLMTAFDPEAAKMIAVPAIVGG